MVAALKIIRELIQKKLSEGCAKVTAHIVLIIFLLNPLEKVLYYAFALTRAKYNPLIITQGDVLD